MTSSNMRKKHEFYIHYPLCDFLRWPVTDTVTNLLTQPHSYRLLLGILFANVAWTLTHTISERLDSSKLSSAMETQWYRYVARPISVLMIRKTNFRAKDSRSATIPMSSTTACTTRYSRNTSQLVVSTEAWNPRNRVTCIHMNSLECHCHICMLKDAFSTTECIQSLWTFEV